MYDLNRKDSSTNFSFSLLSRDEKEKNPAMSSTKLHRDAIMVTEVTRETTRDGGREVKTETILSKRILRAQVSSAFATKRKCARRGNRRNNWRTRRCTADRVPLFRLTGITALEHHGLFSLSSFSSSISKTCASTCSQENTCYWLTPVPWLERFFFQWIINPWSWLEN